MKAILILIRIISFIVLTTLNFEYLVNQQDSTVLLISAILFEIVIFYISLFNLIKKLVKK